MERRNWIVSRPIEIDRGLIDVEDRLHVSLSRVLQEKGEESDLVERKVKNEGNMTWAMK